MQFVASSGPALNHQDVDQPRVQAAEPSSIVVSSRADNDVDADLEIEDAAEVLNGRIDDVVDLVEGRRQVMDHEILGLAPTSFRQRPPSPRPTSDDEVVFLGRKSAAMPKASGPSTPAGEQTSRSERIKVPDQFQVVERTSNLSTSGDMPVSTPITIAVKPSPSTAQRIRTRPQNSRAVEAALDDYVANMRSSGEVDGMELDTDINVDLNGWETSDLQDFDDLSTSEGIFGDVSHVLSKRIRSSGLQYLIIWEFQTVDEARWISHASIPEAAAQLIEAFELAEQNVPEATESSSGDDDSDDDADPEWEDEDDEDEEGDDDELDDMEDERDLEACHKARLSDEAVARLLQKQESLGIFSEDLELFDGIEDVQLAGTRPRSRASRKRSQRRGGKGKSSFVNHEDMLLEGDGDDYLTFDIMDRDRPSINFFNPTKGKNGAAPFAFDLSDSDLASDLKATWEKDRKAKKAKKLEREELRAQGLLGRKNKSKPDLMARYNDGMSLGHLEKELEEFLFNEEEHQLHLPPMDKRDRKHIHDIANLFGLKSKSQGQGKKRFPVLFKTSRSISFEDADFNKLRRELNRKFFPRMDKKGKGKATTGPRRSGGGFGSRADVGYREGEAVGGTAPEIGVENRGRKMAEKMGWSPGTALGALGSGGILTPIAHIVRNSRAGLG